MDARLRILLVEDEPTTRDAVAFGLTDAGYDVVAVGSGQDALAAILKRPPDLAVVDVRLPDGNDTLIWPHLGPL
jgi:two-component system, OmpR family, response regulator